MEDSIMFRRLRFLLSIDTDDRWQISMYNKGRRVALGFIALYCIASSSAYGSSKSVDIDLVPVVKWSEQSRIEQARISHVEGLVAYSYPGTGEADGYVALREIQGGRIRCAWDSQGRTDDLDISPDGTKVMAVLSTAYPRASAPDWQWVVTRDGNYGDLYRERPYLFDTRSCDPIEQHLLKEKSYQYARFSDDGQHLLGVRFDRKHGSSTPAFRTRIDASEPVEWFRPAGSVLTHFTPLSDDSTFLVGYRGDDSHYVAIYERWKPTNPLKRTLSRMVLGKGIIAIKKSWHSGLWFPGDTPELSSDQRRFAYFTRGEGSENNLLDRFAVVRDIETLEETHRWLLGEGDFHIVKFFPQSTDAVLSTMASGTIMIHRLLPDRAQLLRRFDSNIENPFVSFSSDGSMFVISGKERVAERNYLISAYRTEQLGIDL